MKIVFVCAVSPWGDEHGASVRKRNLIESLCKITEVAVIAPKASKSFAATGLRLFEFDQTDVKLVNRFSRWPAEGASVRQNLPFVIKCLVEFQPSIVVWSNSQISAYPLMKFFNKTDLIADLKALRHVVDFANIESNRYAAMSKIGGLRSRLESNLEFIKAKWWEPRVANLADGCLAVSEDERQILSLLNPKTFLAPNGFSDKNVGLSYDSSRVILAVGSWWYQPNSQGMREFISKTWPRIIEMIPEAKLLIAGKGSEAFSHAGVETLGFVDDLAQVYRGAALSLAPANYGAGSQLKIVNSLEHGRIIIGPTYLKREHENGFPPDSVISTNQLAEQICEILLNASERHRRESEIIEFTRLQSWDVLGLKVADWLRRLQIESLDSNRVPSDFLRRHSN